MFKLFDKIVVVRAYVFRMEVRKGLWFLVQK